MRQMMKLFVSVLLFSAVSGGLLAGSRVLPRNGSSISRSFS